MTLRLCELALLILSMNLAQRKVHDHEIPKQRLYSDHTTVEAD